MYFVRANLHWPQDVQVETRSFHSEDKVYPLSYGSTSLCRVVLYISAGKVE